MKRHLGFIALLFFLSAPALAADEAGAAADDIDTLPLEQPAAHPHHGVQPLEQPETRVVPDDHHYPTNFRLNVLGQLVVRDSAPRLPAAGAQATIEFGRGLITAEAGLSFLSTQTNLNVTDSASGGTDAYKLKSTYVGVPLLLKINYIEMPQASFSLKVGVMPAISTKDTSKLDVGDSAGQTYNLSRSNAFAVIGFTGAAALNDESEFVVDVAYDRGITDLDKNGAHTKAITVGLGVRFDL